MLSALGGFEEPALKFLQEEDAAAQKWNRETEGIDLFPSFTLKHQTRKYFFFGDRLTPDYRARMQRAARAWTAVDPLNRPHYAYVQKKEGWDPEAKNSWVDVRNTDNLRLMRDSSVYLFAEETGNEATRLHYKDQLRRFIVAMYYTGMGEWDSENYMGHTIPPLLNLYDFARDQEVQRLAKAALDRAAAMIALKYWRGNFNGPSKRDYNHPYPFGGSAAMAAWLWFGDAPLQPTQFESDEIHLTTSAYRPPAAVVALARKDFPKPVELLAGKPAYGAADHPDEPYPSYRETHYFGQTFQWGTLLRGTEDPDVNGFKILTWSSQRGADTLMAAPIKDPTKLASPQYEPSILAPNSAVGHFRDAAIYLTQEHDNPYLFLVPVDAEIVRKAEITYILCEKTTIALWPINTSAFEVDAALTELVQWERKSSDSERQPRWSNSKILKASRSGPGWYGFAIQIGEGNREQFLASTAQIRPEVDEVPIRGAAVFQNTAGQRFRLQWGNVPSAIHVWRDGQARDWNSPEENAAYHTLTGRLIDQPWQGNGTLTIEASPHKFRCTVTREGAATFSEN